MSMEYGPAKEHDKRVADALTQKLTPQHRKKKKKQVPQGDKPKEEKK